MKRTGHEAFIGRMTMIIVLFGFSVPAGSLDAQAAESDDNGWRAFLEEVRTEAARDTGARAAQAQGEARSVDANAQRWDLGLSLDANTQHFPDGVGTTETETGQRGFTDLRRRYEARIEWEALDFIARRGGRIDQASAEQRVAQARQRREELETASRLVEDAVCNAVDSRREQALENALRAAERAQDKAAAAQAAPDVEVARRAEAGTREAARTTTRIRQRMAERNHCNPAIVWLPDGFSQLPLQAPAPEAVEALAAQMPEVEELEAQADSKRGEAASRRLDGIRVRLHGGLVAHERDAIEGGSEFERGPQLGASLTVPLGRSGSGSRVALESEARSASLEAAAMIERQHRELEQQRHRWASAVARMETTGDELERADERLRNLERRIQQQAGGAPEPWEVELQRADLWLSIDQMWQAREQWLVSLLQWSLRAPDFLEERDPEQRVTGDGLCAPLPGCPS